jgi:hypothetical protein
MPKKAKQPLEKAISEAESLAQWITRDAIFEMGRDSDPRRRLVALCLARNRIDAGDDPAAYFEFARALVTDADNNCRWQALIVVGENKYDNHEAVWQVVAEHGDSADRDMRDGIACVLLEELLHFHFDEYFPRVRQEILNGRTGLLPTLAMCWFDGRGPNYEKVQRFVRTASRGLPGSKADGPRR